MSGLTPEQLAESFKQSANYEKMRQKMVNEFLASVRPFVRVIRRGPFHQAQARSIQPERVALEEKLDALLPGLLQQPTHKQAKPHEVQVHLMRDIETRHPVVQKACADVERKLRAQEREGDGDLSVNLRRLLRGEYCDLAATCPPPGLCMSRQSIERKRAHRHRPSPEMSHLPAYPQCTARSLYRLCQSQSSTL